MCGSLQACCLFGYTAAFVTVECGFQLETRSWLGISHAPTTPTLPSTSLNLFAGFSFPYDKMEGRLEFGPSLLFYLHRLPYCVALKNTPVTPKFIPLDPTQVFP